jgi:hypothetical protein
MRRAIFAGIILAAVAVLPGCVSPQAADGPSALVSVSARIEQYLSKARHLEFSNVPDEWHDAIVFRIVAPKEWEGTKLTVYCQPKPQGHQMRQIGSTWAFKIEKKRIVGRYPGAVPGTFDEYPASEGDLKDLARIE